MCPFDDHVSLLSSPRFGTMISHSYVLLVTWIECTPMNELFRQLKPRLVRRYHAKLRCDEDLGELEVEYQT